MESVLAVFFSGWGAVGVALGMDLVRPSSADPRRRGKGICTEGLRLQPKYKKTAPRSGYGLFVFPVSVG